MMQLVEVGVKTKDDSLLDKGYVFAGKDRDGFYVYYKTRPKNTKFGKRKRDENGHLEDFSCCDTEICMTEIDITSYEEDKDKPVSTDWLG